jgi:hypothetical protein
LSGVIAAIYVLAALVTTSAEHAFLALLFVIFPLACIWFGDAMGGFTGPAGTIGITASSPGVVVRILGWVVLLLPVIFMVV